MNITKDTAAKVLDEVDATLTAIFAKHGLAQPTFSVTYGEMLKITVKASVETLNDKGVNVTSTEALDYETYGDTYGLLPGLLGTKFTSKGKTYTFVGIAPNRPKFPICVIEDASGARMKMTDQAVKLINAAGRAS